MCGDGQTESELVLECAGHLVLIRVLNQVVQVHCLFLSKLQVHGPDGGIWVVGHQVYQIVEDMLIYIGSESIPGPERPLCLEDCGRLLSLNLGATCVVQLVRLGTERVSIM